MLILRDFDNMLMANLSDEGCSNSALFVLHHAIILHNCVFWFFIRGHAAHCRLPDERAPLGSGWSVTWETVDS